jgi:hypothetical protein
MLSISASCGELSGKVVRGKGGKTDDQGNRRPRVETLDDWWKAHLESAGPVLKAYEETTAAAWKAYGEAKAEQETVA